MNMKKIIVSTLAAVTAAVSISAIGANANTLGVSTLDVPFEKVDGEGVSVTATLNGQVGMTLDVTAQLPVDSLAAGDYFFHAELLADQEEENNFVQTVILREDQEIDYFDLLEINFKDKDGNPVQPTGVKLTFKTSKASAHNTVYMYDNGWKNIGTMEEATPMHFSRFAIAAIYENPTSQVSQDSQTSQTSQTTPVSQPSTDVKTGDSTGTTTAIVFAVMALVALGTSVVAIKAKKSSK